MKPVILAICGKAASGKDTLAQYLSSCPLGITNIVSDTTRPPRANEQDGVDYHFISEDDFIDNIHDLKYIEWTRFRGWYYGTPYDAICGKINVGVFNPDGILELYAIQKHEGYNVIPIYIKVPLFTRMRRYIEREGRFSFECIRRIFADWVKFDNIDIMLSVFPQHIVVKNIESPYKVLKKTQDVVFKALQRYYR